MVADVAGLAPYGLPRLVERECFGAGDFEPVSEVCVVDKFNA